MTQMNGILGALVVIPALLLAAYAVNLYTLLWLYRRRRDVPASTHNLPADDACPFVVTQLPVYNEYNVVERAMRAAVLIRYPKGKHLVQVLDDSTDDTRDRIDRVAAELQAEGHAITVVRRPHREGFKAGALEAGMAAYPAPFYAIFDADFVPNADFLERTIPVLLDDEKIGLVQARWGHLNRGESLLTRAQSVGIDGHFGIEQPARAWNKLFMNFNGTAGLWRSAAITDAGGWEHDTITEDMDLSYRAQLAGWKPHFDNSLVVPAELPDDIDAFKSQQFRWAKGSMQTAIKLLPRVLRAEKGFVAKWQAFFHMTHYTIHPLMLWMALAAYPVLRFLDLDQYPLAFPAVLAIMVTAFIAPTLLYATALRDIYPRGKRSPWIIPFLSIIGIGIALSNTRAVFEAWAGKKSPFVRTPKKGDQSERTYRISMPWLGLLEVLVGMWCLFTSVKYMQDTRTLAVPFLVLYAAGFLCVGLLSVRNRFRSTV